MFDFPATPTEGQEFTPSGGPTYVYRAPVWDVKAAASGGGAITSIGDGPPASPTIGQIWWESDTGNMYIWYNDGDSTQWVPGHVGALPEDTGTDILDGLGPPAGTVGVAGDYYLDRTNQNLYGPKLGVSTWPMAVPGDKLPIAQADVVNLIADLTARVLKAGDTMTGNLTINKASPRLALQKLASGQGNSIRGSFGAGDLARWILKLGDETAETGTGNAGSDFVIQRFSDAGTYVDAPLTIPRTTGLATVSGDPTAALGIATKQYVDNFKAVVTVADAAPGSAVQGQLWWDSSTGNLYVAYNDGDTWQWVQINSVGG